MFQDKHGVSGLGECKTPTIQKGLEEEKVVKTTGGYKEKGTRNINLRDKADHLTKWGGQNIGKIT